MIYLSLFLTFLKIGACTFGGGYAMIPLIRSEVLAHGWMEETKLIDFIAVSESTPGPFAVNVSTYIGTVTGGFFGALCATLGVILPSFVIILIVAKCLAKFKESTFVKGILSGLKPAVVALIAAAILSIANTVFFGGNPDLAVFSSAAFYVSLSIFLLSSVLAFCTAHPILIIALSALLVVGAGYAF
ncbi:MAG: chromate transporter, partial [Clostridia bacterium]|nr:chromate transporter [Clostridia bacterium]